MEDPVATEKPTRRVNPLGCLFGTMALLLVFLLLLAGIQWAWGLVFD